jgi:hypothetical protein
VKPGAVGDASTRVRGASIIEAMGKGQQVRHRCCTCRRNRLATAASDRTSWHACHPTTPPTWAASHAASGAQYQTAPLPPCELEGGGSCSSPPAHRPLRGAACAAPPPAVDIRRFVVWVGGGLEVAACGPPRGRHIHLRGRQGNEGSWAAAGRGRQVMLRSLAPCGPPLPPPPPAQQRLYRPRLQGLLHVVTPPCSGNGTRLELRWDTSLLIDLRVITGHGGSPASPWSTWQHMHRSCAHAEVFLIVCTASWSLVNMVWFYGALEGAPGKGNMPPQLCKVAWCCIDGERGHKRLQTRQ